MIIKRLYPVAGVIDATVATLKLLLLEKKPVV